MWTVKGDALIWILQWCYCYKHQCLYRVSFGKFTILTVYCVLYYWCKLKIGDEKWERLSLFITVLPPKTITFLAPYLSKKIRHDFFLLKALSHENSILQKKLQKINRFLQRCDLNAVSISNTKFRVVSYLRCCSNELITRFKSYCKNYFNIYRWYN